MRAEETSTGVPSLQSAGIFQTGATQGKTTVNSGLKGILNLNLWSVNK